MQEAYVVPRFCSRLFKSGSWVFLVSLYLVGPEFPQLLMHTGILSPV